jgi:hypothetical protein
MTIRALVGFLELPPEMDAHFTLFGRAETGRLSSLFASLLSTRSSSGGVSAEPLKLKIVLRIEGAQNRPPSPSLPYMGRELSSG